MDAVPAPPRVASTDGNFAVPQPAVALPFTGERMTSAAAGQIEFEHYHRYCLARDICAGRDVLDVACGEGYGAVMLAGVATNVIGVDIDARSIAHATLNYRAANLSFRRGDALALPVGDASVDAVVSFETLEHLGDHAGFLGEVRRVLRPGGLLVISTPDRSVYSAPGSEPNPYHVLELTEPELSALLRAHFAAAAILRQRPVLGSLVAAPDDGWRSYERRSPSVIEATGGLARAHYLLGVASDGPLPPLPSSVYLDRQPVHRVIEAAADLPRALRNVDIFIEERDAARREAARLQEELREAAASSSARLAEAEDTVAHLRAEIDRLAADTQRAEAERQRDEAGASLADARRRLREAEEAAAILRTRLHRRHSQHMHDATEQLQDGPPHDGRLQKIGEQVAALEQALAQAAVGRANADAMAASQVEHIKLLEHEIEVMRCSFGWHLTAPLRAAERRAPRLARLAKRLLRAIWWTVSLQIGYRAMLWWRYRAAAAASKPIAADVVPEANPPDAPPPLPESKLPEAPPPAAAIDLRAAFIGWYGAQPIHFPAVEAPVVSIIIPAFQGFPDLKTCLRSLSVHRAGEPAFEVILVDDCPWARILSAIPSSPGLVKLANDANQGFVLTCNRGAAAARGRHLVFLNADTIVSPGWLAALVDAAETTPEAALVGGMLLNQDGTIQSAGWRIMADGWGHAIGAGRDPHDGAYTYRRAVDCVTGACLLVPADRFAALGGFDPDFAPAFYEEFDLAFRARARGWQVLYEPRSRVVHLGSASYGAAERDRLSTINHQRFADRHAGALRRHPWDTADEFPLRHAIDTGPVLLAGDYGIPHPDRHAGDVTVSRYLGLFAAAGFRVVFAPHDGEAEGPDAAALERQGIELVRAPQTLAGWLAAHGRHVDAVWLARPEIAGPALHAVETHTNAFVAYYTHDLHHVRLQREAELHGDPAKLAEAAEMLALEKRIFSAVDCVTSPSQAECATVHHLVPEARTAVLPPFFYEASEIVSRSAAHFSALTDVVFVGGFPHRPNVDAACFIATEVMPLVWRSHPDARLVLIGYAPPPEVLALAGPRVAVTGQVPDLAPFMDAARVCLAAVRYGAGVKGKVVQAMQCGVPVVTTPVGAEGIALVPGRDALIGEDAPALAAAVIGLLADPQRCADLSAAGAALVAARFSRAAARAAIAAVFTTPRCAVCGSTNLADEADTSGSESLVCRNCFAIARTEALARVALGRLAQHGETSFTELARGRPAVRVHEFGTTGAIADTWRGWSGFSVSDFIPGPAPGSAVRDGVRGEDLCQLSFADASFDMVISQHVLQCVADPSRALSETWRVLRPGGAHVFTVPYNPALPASRQRLKLVDGHIERLLPAEHDEDPPRCTGDLVVTDFGADLPLIARRAGFDLRVHTHPVADRESLLVFEAVKSS